MEDTIGNLLELSQRLAAPWVPGLAGFMQRLRDLVERGRIDLSQLQLANLMKWVLARAEVDGTISDLCGSLEAAARLALLKARRLNGAWQTEAVEAGIVPWGGPPAELPLRKSWLGERIATGQLSFVATPRSFDTVTPELAPIAPSRLRAAMLAMLQRQAHPRARQVVERTPRLSTEVCSALILQRLEEHGELCLSGIAGDTRDAHVAAFLAALILARQGKIMLVQDELFGDVRLTLATESLTATA